MVEWWVEMRVILWVEMMEQRQVAGLAQMWVVWTVHWLVLKVVVSMGDKSVQ